MTKRFIFNPQEKNSCEVNDPGDALALVRAYITLSQSFELAIPKDDVNFIEQLTKIIEQLGINAESHPDSDPELIDYLLNATVSGCIGAGQGTIAGSSIWASIAGTLTVAAKVGVAVTIPPAAPYVVTGAVIGGVAGVASGLQQVRWRIKISYRKRLIIYNKDNFIFFYFEYQS